MVSVVLRISKPRNGYFSLVYDTDEPLDSGAPEISKHKRCEA